jgi:alginate O-acetyltransferase complex protein AlgJ
MKPPHSKLVFLGRLPLVLMAILLGLPLGLKLVAKILGEPILTREIRLFNQPLVKYGFNGPALVGLREQPASPENNFLTGDYQKNIEGELNRSLPLRPRLVRATNQFYHSLFHKSYMLQESILIGKNDVPYVMQYVTNYCGGPAWNSPTENDKKTARRVFNTLDAVDIDVWITDVKKINNFYTKRGKIFLYVIAPSKAAHDPEQLPDQLPCPLPTEDSQRNLLHQHKVAALEKSGIPYINGYKILADAKNEHPLPLFPKGGMHWNLLGAGLVVQEIQNHIAQVTNKPLQPIDLSYSISDHAEGTDIDLINILNLWSVDYRYPVPVMNFRSPKMQNLRLAIVGDSFGEQMIKVFEEVKTFCQIDEYYYFTGTRKQFIIGKTGNIELPPNPGRPQLMGPPPKNCGSPMDSNNTLKPLLEADVVILEQTTHVDMAVVKPFSDALRNLDK